MCSVFWRSTIVNALVLMTTAVTARGSTIYVNAGCGNDGWTGLNPVCVAACIAGVSSHRIAGWRSARSRSGTTTSAAVPQYR